MINCMLSGVGGQGTVLASRLIAQAAMANGEMAMTAETIGMAQRGGCVVSHVRCGKEVASSLIPKGMADIIIGFEPNEAVRVLPYLKKGGTVITTKRSVEPVTGALTGKTYPGEVMIDYLKKTDARVIVVDADEICKEVGSFKVLNIILLGAAVKSGVLGISPEEMKETIKERVKPKFVDLNLKAFDLAYERV
ncbi:MAG: indolepyruvate oxidoreductase subunit beta [Lachnospiraceae bacterium]|jgi:indolepyruvate ferredoxin oxidoreductase beta subunit|nr:indolepyruvate oxidoreductase subunit beta [Lachnospiraceae bacterium]HAP33167.1 pyruvate ferredoxin oxidoreductase [Lachnospiraceae bacterium]HBR05017.1 pyruvate ferredoxin oxidoreductase [Lachnospiraceae bacterium]HBZ90459.1 pyruvate ferredoxin oxidoreductase [Lachnospiraceae bacterium]